MAPFCTSVFNDWCWHLNRMSNECVRWLKRHKVKTWTRSFGVEILFWIMKYSVVHLITNSLVLTALNGGICIFGDYLVERNHESQILKAICDNTTHALIGLFSALIMILEANRRIGGIERISLIVICTIVSSFIDFDHFVVAKSIKLSVIFHIIFEIQQIDDEIQLIKLMTSYFFQISESSEYWSKTIFTFYNHSNGFSGSFDSFELAFSFVSLKLVARHRSLRFFIPSYTWCNQTRIHIVAFWNHKTGTISVIHYFRNGDAIPYGQVFKCNQWRSSSIPNSRSIDS